MTLPELDPDTCESVLAALARFKSSPAAPLIPFAIDSLRHELAPAVVGAVERGMMLPENLPATDLHAQLGAIVFGVRATMLLDEIERAVADQLRHHRQQGGRGNG